MTLRFFFSINVEGFKAFVFEICQPRKQHYIIFDYIFVDVMIIPSIPGCRMLVFIIPLKFNVALEQSWLERGSFPFGMVTFQIRCDLRGVV